MVLIFHGAEPWAAGCWSVIYGRLPGKSQDEYGSSGKEQETALGFLLFFHSPCHTGSSLIFFFLSKVVALSMLMA
mgnify:CR=1 FL=1